jgi:hypothetical protein
MKKTTLLSSVLAFCLIVNVNINAQLGKSLLNKAKEDTKSGENKSNTQTDGKSAIPELIPNAGEGFIVPSSVYVTANKSEYLPQKNNNYSAWFPSVQFTLVGPVKRSTKISVQYSVNNKPWFKHDFSSMELGLNEVYVLGTDVADVSVNDDVPQLTVGIVGFKITASDALAGTNKELFSGSFKVNKLFVGSNAPEDKNKYEWYVDYDWALPIAYVGFLRKDLDLEAPIELYFWFRNRYEDNDEYSAHLFYQGKEIANRDGNNIWYASVKSSSKKIAYSWTLEHFELYNVLAHYRNDDGSDREPGSNHVLARNPGEYELKVIRGGELVRSAKFTILPNGKLDNSLNMNNNFRGSWTVIPAKVLGTSDGTWNNIAWSTDMYWGNVLKGFALLK